MSSGALGAAVSRRLGPVTDKAAVLALFSGTIFVSALLLFSVQPLFAKLVLPKLGGAPSVWAVSMCFFQAVLLAGYCYAHALNRLAPARWAPFIHLCLLGMAMLALPVGLPTGLADPPAGSTYVWLLGLLAAGVGLPFFAVSANAPLLQAWFARTGHPHAGDPYFLYGASNLGSLAALLLYPVLIEPFIGLGSQSAMWTAGFVGLGLMIAASGLTMVMSQRPATEPPIAAMTQPVLPGVEMPNSTAITVTGCSISIRRCEMTGIGRKTRMKVARNAASGSTQRNGAEAISVVT